MKRILIVLCLLFGAVFTAAPVWADHASAGDLFPDGEGDRWNESVSHPYCISQEFYTMLNQATYQNATSSIVNAINRWENNTDLDDGDFSGAGFPGCGNMALSTAIANAGGFQNFNHAEFCNNREDQNHASSIQYESFAASDLEGGAGVGITCDYDENGRIDHFFIGVDSDLGPGGFNQLHFNWETDPALFEFDFHGLFMHEFGHALGFGIHISDACSHSGSFNTMCGEAWGYFNDSGTPTGKENRTLEPHDTGALNEVYP